MLESRVTVREGHRPRLALVFEGGPLASVALLDETVTRGERIETVPRVEEVSRELVGRSLDQLHRAPPLGSFHRLLRDAQSAE